VQLTKHHGLGNDFLVALDPYAVRRVGAELARAVCDRRRGVGADGLLWLTAGTDGADVRMQLFNADGSPAEISGNGLGCLVQAALVAGLVRPPVVQVATDAGLRSVEVVEGPSHRLHHMTVDMGTAVIEGDEPEWIDDDILRASRVDMGNPHLVLHAPDPDVKLDVAERGRAINEVVPGGVNVEIMRVDPDNGDLVMDVYERGVGVTQACGTGACAVAVAAHAWDLCGERVRVHMPGGATDIVLGERVSMTTPIVFVATVEFPWP
jgi:diaminopimelate epimerase